ncbi:hypothetical protein GCM10022252_75350 [Streptosporangium oxazolinicum]|uniref:Uncharacterized protein n=1 Tax=Streptosporangium oxazolinicum TaxID=909287 RepID=A0ABP8BKX1_9ACTN
MLPQGFAAWFRFCAAAALKVVLTTAAAALAIWVIATIGDVITR